MPETNGASRSWLSGLADEAGRYVNERIDRFTDNLGGGVGQHVIARRLAGAAATADAGRHENRIL